MKKSMIPFLALLAALAIGAPAARADDIDIFSGVGGSTVPNILFVVDSRSSNEATVGPYTCSYAPLSNGKMLRMLQCALYMAINSMNSQPALSGKLNMAIMVAGPRWYFPANPPPYSFTLMDPAGVSAMSAVLQNVDNLKTSGNGSLGDEMYESWAFFTGHTGPTGIPYSSHIGGTLSCQKSFIVMIGNVDAKHTASNSAGGSVSDLQNAIPTPTAAQLAKINTSSIGPNTNEDGSSIDEWARYLYQTDFNSNANDRQSVVTYTIGTYGDGGIWADKAQEMQSAANQGGGKAFLVDDLNTFTQVLNQIFNEVAAVNSVFASSSLPVSANAQGTYNNQVFIGMFRPDASDAPRWMGNLKQYQFGVSGTPPNQSLFLADANGVDAISAAGTGFITPTAVSLWTSTTSGLPDSIGGFWLNNPQGSSGGHDNPDGEVVEKGGAGQQLRLANLQDNYTTNPSTPRNMYTCNGACGAGANLSSALFATTNSNLTSTALGINNPIYTVSASQISRKSSTGIVTVTLAATPNPSIAMPSTASISGSTNAQFDYSLASDAPSASGTTITYTLPAEYPPTPATGTYTATGSAAGSSTVSSLTRSSGNGLITVTAILGDLTFGGSTTAAVGDTINIANSTGYNGSGTVTLVNTGTSTIQYSMSETPSVYGGGGQISVGSSTCTTNGNSSGHNCDGIGPLNTNAPGAGQASLPGLVRGTSCAGCVANSGNVLMVNFPGGTTNLNAVTPLTGVQAYIKSPASPSSYVNTTTGWKIVGIGASCSVTETHTDGTTRTYTGTATSGTKYFTLCLDLGASFVLAPLVVGNGATGSTTATRQGSATRQIASLTHGVSNCPTTVNATATVATSAAHGFSTGESIGISSSAPGPNEAAYIGTFPVTVVDSTHFTYTVATTPACTDSKSGMTVTYQSSVGGIDPNALIQWVRGDDNIGDEQSPGNGITIRPSVHGDVIHSRPTIVNYGGSTGVVAFYGANDGTFRAVNANLPSGGNIGSAVPGGEIWSFIPPDFLFKLQRLYSNSPLLKLASTPTGLTPTPTAKDYFFDGTTGVYQNGTTVYIYPTGRRGVDASGNGVIYALDVSSPTNPKFLWKHTNADSGFSELGQVWSTPRAVQVKGYTTNPVLIFGAGYDANEDGDPPTLADASGRGIFVLDAVTGNLVWKAVFSSGGSAGSCTGNPCNLSDMNYAIPADLALLDRNYDGFIDRIYAADTGGNIWRVDLEPSGNLPANWQVTKFASLGGSGSPKRKFLYPPDVVTTANFDIVLAGTGDREHPLYSASTSSSYAVVNRFYGLKDTNTGMNASGWTTITDGTSSTSNSAVTGLFDATSTLFNPVSSMCNGSLCSGFYISLATNPGEKVVNAPTTVGGLTYFGTSTPPTPSSQTCNNLGTARGYAVNFATGVSVSNTIDGGGLPPSPVAGLVSINVNGTMETLPFLIGANPTTSCTGPDCRSSLGASRPPIPVPPVRNRAYWYIQNHDN